MANSNTNIIVDTMSISEVHNFVRRNSFSDEIVSSAIRKIESMENKYIRFARKKRNWSSQHPYCIFSPIEVTRNGEVRLIAVPYISNGMVGKCIDVVMFTTIFYRRNKYVVFDCPKGSDIFFSWHSLKRYAERFLENPNAPITNELIGSFLIYNHLCVHTEYTCKDEIKPILVTLHGIFLCDTTPSTCIIAKTFISKKEYFEKQASIDEVGYKVLREMVKERWGVDLEREECAELANECA